VLQRSAAADAPLLSAFGSGPSAHLVERYGTVTNPYDAEEPSMATAPADAPVDKTFTIAPALAKLVPKVREKRWTKAPSTPSGTLATYSRPGRERLVVSMEDMGGKISGQYTDERGGSAYEPSWITYEPKSRKLIEQKNMKSDPERKGIATVLCYEGLCYAQRQGYEQVFVQNANDNSAKLLKLLLDDDTGGGCCGGCCFLVTACAEARGLPADCAELRVLRGFRDDYLVKTTGGEAMVALYYEIAPRIVEAIRAAPEPGREFAAIYDAIRECVELVEKRSFEEAVQFYRSMVQELAGRFLPRGGWLSPEAKVSRT
jgi:hypothetical protein